MSKTRDLPFSMAEYQHRLGFVRQEMAARGIEGLIVITAENLYYMTGHRTPGYYAYQVLLVPAEGAPTLIVRFLEETNATALSWVEDVVSVQDTEDNLEVTLRTLRERGYLGKRLGLDKETLFLSPNTYERLASLLQGQDIVDGSGLVEEARLRKSPQEIAYIRKAVAVAEAGMQAGFDAVAPGASEDEIAAEVHRAIIRAGGEYMSLPPFICSGPRSALAHATWEGRRLDRDDVVFFEISGCVKRYSGALMRTVALGNPSPDILREADAVIGGLTRAIDAMAPGVPCAEIDRLCRSYITDQGYGHLFRHRTGYSIGVNFPPDWGEGQIRSLKGNELRPLEAGMVFHLPPALLGNGKYGVGFSETVLITPTGHEVLTSLPRQLLVKRGG